MPAEDVCRTATAALLGAAAALEVQSDCDRARDVVLHAQYVLCGALVAPSLPALQCNTSSPIAAVLELLYALAYAVDTACLGQISLQLRLGLQPYTAQLLEEEAPASRSRATPTALHMPSWAWCGSSDPEASDETLSRTVADAALGLPAALQHCHVQPAASLVHLLLQAVQQRAERVGVTPLVVRFV